MQNWFSFLKGRDVKKNFFVNVFDGSVYSFAISFISFSTVMPVFVKKIGGSNIAVGLIPVFWTLGFNIPQILVANSVRKLPYKKGLLLVTALGQRIPWLLLGIFCLTVFEKISGEVQLVIFFFCYGLAAIAGAINLPGWFDLVAKVTPVKIRGKLFAARAFMGGLLGITGGWASKIIIEKYAYPLNFAILFFLAFGVIMVSYAALFFLKEHEPNPAKEELHYKEFFKRIPSMVKYNVNYRNFLIADALLISSLMADAFYALNAIHKFSLPYSIAGTFTIIMMSSVIAGNFLFGFLADKFGHKLNLWMAATSTFIACLLALTASTPLVYYLVFVFSASTTTLLQVSRLTIIAELCGEQDRPSYIAVTNVITAPFILLGVLGGWIADISGYNIIFISAGIFALISSIILRLKVKEPRHLPITVTS